MQLLPIDRSSIETEVGIRSPVARSELVESYRTVLPLACDVALRLAAKFLQNHHIDVNRSINDHTPHAFFDCSGPCLVLGLLVCFLLFVPILFPPPAHLPLLFEFSLVPALLRSFQFSRLASVSYLAIWGGPPVYIVFRRGRSHSGRIHKLSFAHASCCTAVPGGRTLSRNGGRARVLTPDLYGDKDSRRRSGNIVSEYNDYTRAYGVYCLC